MYNEKSRTVKKSYPRCILLARGRLVTVINRKIFQAANRAPTKGRSVGWTGYEKYSTVRRNRLQFSMLGRRSPLKARQLV